MDLEKLKTYTDQFTEYTELRVQENRYDSIVLVNGDVRTNNKSSQSGISARVYKNGLWGFSSSPLINGEEIKKIINTATQNAVFMSKHENRGVKELPRISAESVNDFSTKKSHKKQNEVIEFIKEVDDYILEKYPNLQARTVILGTLDMEKSLVTSDKSYSYSMIPRSILYVILTVLKDGVPIQYAETFGGLGQFEDVFSTPDKFYEKIDTQYEHLMKKAEGIYAEAGVKDCILDADLAGILAHEAIGHTTEADIVLGGSVAGEYMNEEVASPLVTLIDFANTAFGETCPVPVYIDDEGTKAEDAVLIENGILKSYMHNKDTARHFGVKPTGNARGFQFSDEPLIRMRNTVILPGESKLQDMIASIDDGYYLIKPSNGQADSTSEFMFGITLGYEIKNGKLGKAIRDTTISGVAFDLLKTITMISDDMSWSCSGMCGKKQPIPVGMGGPAIKCKVNIGGK